MALKDLEPHELVLLILDHAGGSLSGKTLLQKRAYFLSELSDLNLDYRAHYYGPYSPALEGGLGRAKALGFVDERTLGFGVPNRVGLEMRRYDYSLTDDGKEVVGLLKQQYSRETQQLQSILGRISEAGDGDYMSLSVAAKIHHILKRQGVAMTVEEIQKAARDLGWQIGEDSTSGAISFLQELGLLK